MTDVQLLNKTEVWMTGVHLSNADLPDFAATCATALSLPKESVFVTDVRTGVVVLDILIPVVRLEDIVGKQQVLFKAIKKLNGIKIDTKATIHSEGVLGMIGQPPDLAEKTLAEARRMEDNIRKYASSRVAVIATGTELADGTVKDTNFEVVLDILEPAGYEVVMAGIAGDNENEIAGMINRIASEGFGIVIITGGVGAEDKDRTVEALELIDPDLSTAVLAEYTIGQGRHMKDTVRIGVAILGWTTVIALPGPTHEVKLALPVIAQKMKAGVEPSDLVEAIAVPLRGMLPGDHNCHSNNNHKT
jgi:molybdenum cofactor synthesis domain-containing protein